MGFLARLFAPRAPRVQPVHVDDGNYKEEVARSALPVVLDVWSLGCGPCQMMEPLIMDLASAYEGRGRVHRGHGVHRVVGFVGARYLREVVEAELLGPASAWRR
jgi:thiol-disulfide isomerase/thioredoxin